MSPTSSAIEDINNINKNIPKIDIFFNYVHYSNSIFRIKLSGLVKSSQNQSNQTRISNYCNDRIAKDEWWFFIHFKVYFGFQSG